MTKAFYKICHLSCPPNKLFAPPSLRTTVLNNADNLKSNCLNALLFLYAIKNVWQKTFLTFKTIIVSVNKKR